MSRSQRKGILPKKAVAEVKPPEFSDDALALEFAEKTAGYLRFCPEVRSWMSWNGQRWQKDHAGTAINTIRRICRDAAARIDQGPKAIRMASNQKIVAVESLARTDPRLAAPATNWDSNDWLLNTPEGIVDLRTGKLGPHDPLFLMTQMTDVAPEGDCPTWHRFLDRVTAGDKEFQLFLHRTAGYCLTGSTREQALFFLLGPGANGKSIFLRVLATLLGSYATTAAMDTFLETKLSRHPADLAALKSARVVVASETNRKARWDEARIKLLTGGDTISARLMRQDFSTFIPKLKILISGNDAPCLSGTGDAIRRRFRFIPFTVTIPTAERDPELFAKLCEELPGILRWAIEGCRSWQEKGLAPAPCVENFTASYFESEDVLGQFLTECCAVDPACKIGSRILYSAYVQWSSRQGESALSQRSFLRDMAARGFTPYRSAQQRYVKGLRLTEQSHQSAGTGS